MKSGSWALLGGGGGMTPHSVLLCFVAVVVHVGFSDVSALCFLTKHEMMLLALSVNWRFIFLALPKVNLNGKKNPQFETR